VASKRYAKQLIVSHLLSIAEFCETAKLGLPVLYHLAMRQFFTTRVMESGVDVPTVSRWLGHKDGGQLAMKVYFHLRPTHSDAMIARVSFEQAPAVVPMQAA